MTIASMLSDPPPPSLLSPGPGTPKTPKRNRVNFDKARANMDLDGLTEIVQKMVTFHFEKDEAKKEELTKELFSSYLPNQLGYYEKILKLYQASRIKNLQRGWLYNSFAREFHTLVHKNEYRIAIISSCSRQVIWWIFTAALILWLWAFPSVVKKNIKIRGQ